MSIRSLTTGLLLCLSQGAFAQDVLIVNATSYVADVQSKLVATGRYGAVDLYNAGLSTPSLAALQSYDAILVISDSNFSDSAGLGNVVADYADGGGGVVVCTFAFHSPGGALSLGGRMVSDGYLPFTGSGQGTNTGGLLAAQLAHPILAGVASFSNGTAGFTNSVTLTPGADRVAFFSDGFTELVATMETNGSRVAGLNFYPPSSDIRADFWSSATDGDLLMANALDWTITASCPYGDADADGVCDADDICPGFDDRADTDTDGVPDGCDVCPGGNDALDDDTDGQPNGCDPCPDDNPDDTDGDGICDGEDQCPNGDDVLDGDGDGVPDGCDPCPLDASDDTDLDGACDGVDRCPGFPDFIDADVDGVPDQCDSCPNDNPDDADGNGICDSEDPAAEEGTDLGDGRTSLGGCLCQSGGGSPGVPPLLLLALFAARRRTGTFT